MTTALEGGEVSASRPGRFTPGKDPVPIVQEAGWAPGSVWTGAENLASHRDSIPGPFSPYPVAIPTELPGRLIVCVLTHYSSCLWNLELPACRSNCAKVAGNISEFKHFYLVTWTKRNVSNVTVCNTG